MKSVVYVNFRKKTVVPEGFRVNKESDANLVYRKFLEADRALFAERKWELPLGPNCPGDEKIIALATGGGRFLHEESEEGKTMTTAFMHLETCERCDALCRKTVLERKWSREFSDENKNDR